MSKGEEIYRKLLEIRANLDNWSFTHPDMNKRRLFEQISAELQINLRSYASIVQINTQIRFSDNYTLSVRNKYSKTHIDSVVDEINLYFVKSVEESAELAMSLGAVALTLKQLSYEIQRTW